ncbi:uncharacterized protein LOC141605424 isoform X1 [Silene latifolia]|uniref:uncharacterized protein LOC141605424 isoform X1 n=1 Tax=Silene latifolia TaxID=37657 RepID=UPI003D77FD26
MAEGAKVYGYLFPYLYDESRCNLRQDGRARLSLSTMVNLMILDQATMCLSLGVLDVGSSGTLKYLGSSGIYSLLVMRIFVCCIMAKLAVSN